MGVSMVCPHCQSRMTMEALQFDGCEYNIIGVPHNKVRQDWFHCEPHNLFQVLYKCGNKKCNSLIIAEYYDEETEEKLQRCYPYRAPLFDFSNFPNIVNLSKSFINIFNEAFCAEGYGLKTVAGPGYRKSIEYLVKDYLVFTLVDDDIKEKIPQMGIMDCINKFIDNEELKNLSKHAFRLGNDQVHYYQKWEDKDIDYLKKIITTLMSYVEMKLNIFYISKDFSKK